MTLDLTCVDLSVEDVIGCAYGLSPSQSKLFLAILRVQGFASIGTISKQTGKERSVVQKTIAKLLTRGIVHKEQHNKEGAGYEYLYCAKDKEAIKKEIKTKTARFCSIVNEEMKKW